MELYLKVSFWLCIVTIVLRGFIVTVAPYPRRLEYSLGEDVVGLMMTIAQLVWVSALLYG